MGRTQRIYDMMSKITASYIKGNYPRVEQVLTLLSDAEKRVDDLEKRVEQLEKKPKEDKKHGN